jgi:FMN reductase
LKWHGCCSSPSCATEADYQITSAQLLERIERAVESAVLSLNPTVQPDASAA